MVRTADKGKDTFCLHYICVYDHQDQLFCELQINLKTKRQPPNGKDAQQGICKLQDGLSSPSDLPTLKKVTLAHFSTKIKSAHQ